MPRFAFNGGVSGIRRVPTTSEATGIWDLHQQNEAQRAGIWPQAGGDPNFSSVSLLLHMNGSNGGTTFTDSSQNARAITVQGNAQTSTAQSKFGTASCLLDGSGDSLSATITAIGTGAYTIEGWFYSSLTLPDWHALVALSDGLTLYYHQGAVVAEGGGAPGSSLRSKQGTYGPLSALTANAWHHWAITRTSGGVLNVFADGLAGGLSNGAGSAQTGNTYDSTGTTFRVGCSPNGNYYFFNGYIDEVRFTPGVARYTADYTTPTVAFPDY